MNRQQCEEFLHPKYVSRELFELFSDKARHKRWRQILLALARAEKKADANITANEITMMQDYVDNIDYGMVKTKSAETMTEFEAHALAYEAQAGDVVARVRKIVTMNFIDDNTLILDIYDGLRILRQKLLAAMQMMADNAEKYKGLPTLNFVDGKKIEAESVGKRISLWIQEMVLHLDAMTFVESKTRLEGCRGVAGTASNVLQEFYGRENSSRVIDKAFAEYFGFTELGFNHVRPKVYAVSSCDYPWSYDLMIVNLLHAIVATIHMVMQDMAIMHIDIGNLSVDNLTKSISYLTTMQADVWRSTARQRGKERNSLIRCHEYDLRKALVVTDGTVGIFMQAMRQMKVDESLSHQVDAVKMAGRSVGQVEDYLREEIYPLLTRECLKES